MRHPFSVFSFFVLMGSLLFLGSCSNNPGTSPETAPEEQPSEPETSGTFGGSGDDIGKSIIGTADGGLFISGTTTSVNGDFEGLSRGNRDVFAIKLTQSGSLSYINTYGGTNSDWAMDSAEDSQGNLYITGYSRSNDQQFTGQNRGENDLFLMKITFDGSLAWARTFGGSGEDYGYALQIINEQIYIAGTTRSAGLDGSDKTGTDKDILLLKTDLDGEPEWIRTFGSSGNDEALSITQNASGNIVLAGSFETGDGLFTSALPGLFGAFAVELDTSGAIQRVSTFSGSGTDIGQSVYTTEDNGYIIGGVSDSADGNFSTFDAGSKNGFLIKLDENFDPVWTLSAGGEENDEVHSVFPAGENLWAAVGETRSGDFLSETSAYEGLNAFLILFDSDGNIQEKLVFGGSRSETAFDITKLDSGELAISGWTLSNDGPFGGPVKAGRDTYFLKVSPDNPGAVSGE